jgi:hypothetical protein
VQYLFRDPRLSAVLDHAACAILSPMKTGELKTVLARVNSWPKSAQEEAVKALREIEEDFIIGPSTRQELDRSHQDALRGKGVSLEDIKERLGI